MAKIIPEGCKLNRFTPVRIPKTRDIFKRMGYRTLPHSNQSDKVADFSRNPLSHFDSESRKMNEFYYQKYVEEANKADSEKDSEKPTQTDDSDTKDSDPE